MTTIAYDGKTIAADGLVTSDNVREERSAKKIVVEDGRIFALAGTQCMMRPLIEWIAAGAEPSKVPNAGDNAWGMLVVTKDGNLHYHHKVPFPEGIGLPFASGSGRDIALGAMKAGKSARAAVEIACDLDVWSGGEITSFDVAEALGLAPEPKVVQFSKRAE